MTHRYSLFDDLAPRSVHCGTVCELGDGTLLAAAYAFSYETSPDTTIITERFDGAGWGDRRVAVDLPGIAVGNPVLWRDASGLVQLYFVVLHGGSWTDAVVCVQESTDEGRSWSGARVVFEQRGLMTKTRPVQLESRFILPVYDERTWCSHVLVHDQAGWQLYGDTTSRGRTIQPAIVPLDEHRLLMYSRSPRGVLQESLSFNGGYAWTASQPTILPNPNSGVDLLRLSSGSLLLAYNPTSTGREQLAVAHSDDGGGTWSEPLLLEDSAGEHSYPYLIEARDGTVHLLYSAQRTSIIHRHFQATDLPGLISPSSRKEVRRES